jgi:hypothetical protein
VLGESSEDQSNEKEREKKKSCSKTAETHRAVGLVAV